MGVGRRWGKGGTEKMGLNVVTWATCEALAV